MKHLNLCCHWPVADKLRAIEPTEWSGVVIGHHLKVNHNNGNNCIKSKCLTATVQCKHNSRLSSIRHIPTEKRIFAIESGQRRKNKITDAWKYRILCGQRNNTKIYARRRSRWNTGGGTDKMETSHILPENVVFYLHGNGNGNSCLWSWHCCSMRCDDTNHQQ